MVLNTPRLALAMFDPLCVTDYVLWCYWKNKVPCVRCLKARMIKRWCHDSDYASNIHLQCYRCGWGWPVFYDTGLTGLQLEVFGPLILQSIWAYGMTRDKETYMNVMDMLDLNAKYPESYRGVGTRRSWAYKKGKLYNMAVKVWETSHERPIVDRMLEGRLERGVDVPEPPKPRETEILRPPLLRVRPKSPPA